MEGREEEPGIVADTNILISALLKDNSINSQLIKAKIFSIYFPDYGLKEVKRRQRTHAASGGASKALPHEIGSRLI